MLTLYMDHNVHARITSGLRRRDVDCLTAFEDNAAQLPDLQLLQRATQLGRILFSQDPDFLALATEQIRGKIAFSGLIYAPQLGITIGQAVRDLEMIAKVLEPEEMV